MTTVHRERARHRALSCFRRAATSALALLLLIAPAGFSSPGNSPEDSGLKLGLVERMPVPGAAAIPLDQAVAQVRHDYGRFLLARFTPEQEKALRDAGYTVRVFEDPGRVGLGFYSFRVPPGPLNLPADLTVDESRFTVGTYLIKLIGPARDEWLSEIRALGGEVLTPIPEFTYLVRMPPRQRSRVSALAYVEWVGAYHPAFKLSGELARRNEEETLPAGPVKLNVLIYRSADVEGAVNRIRGMGGEILNRMPAYFSEMATVRISGSRVGDLARLPEVYVVEVAPEPRLEDECATQILAGQVDDSGIPYRPYYGLPTYSDWLAARRPRRLQRHRRIRRQRRAERGSQRAHVGAGERERLRHPRSRRARPVRGLHHGRGLQPHPGAEHGLPLWPGGCAGGQLHQHSRPQERRRLHRR